MKKLIAILLASAMIFGVLCSCDSSCNKCNEHKWNSGELTNSTTITYTCENCETKRTETVSADADIVTRGELEEALLASAWAYYMKGEKLQYDENWVTKISNTYGGITHHTYEVAPEYGTSDTSIYSVCTAYIQKAYFDALNIRILENKYHPIAIFTSWLWMAADNQPEQDYAPTSGAIDPITENDKDTAIIRWMDYGLFKVKEASQVQYMKELQVFNSSAFTDWNSDLEFRESDGDYDYYLNGKITSPSTVKDLVKEYIMKNSNGVYENLRVGDLMVYDGHALIYIGGGRVLDCTGKYYLTGNGVEQYEENGAVYGRMRTVESTLTSAKTDFVVVRPLDYYGKDFDGDPSNDIMLRNGESIHTTEKVKSRIEYPAMDIDRTVNITPYGTAVKGENLTYKIKISNKTNETNYCSWRGNGYSGQEYKELVITEQVPEGTEFVSATGEYIENDGKLTWTVNIPAGESVELTYTVKVTKAEGEIITNDGGFVANIPSNSISNRVGGKKLNSTQQNVLTQLAKDNSVADWKNTYGTGIDFANNVYKKMGYNLDLPSAEELVSNLFTPTLYETRKPLGIMYKELTNPLVMYTPQQTVKAEYQDVQKMLVDGYYGGFRMFDLDVKKLEEVGLDNFDFKQELNKSIKEFKLEYLEPGDIIVYGTAKYRTDTGLTEELYSTRIMIYAGNQTLIVMNSDGLGRVYTDASALLEITSSFWQNYDIFFALRPSQSI